MQLLIAFPTEYYSEFQLIKKKYFDSRYCTIFAIYAVAMFPCGIEYRTECTIFQSIVS